MRVTQRTSDTLVVEEDAGTKIMIGSFCAGLGGFAAIAGWTKGQTLFSIIGSFFALFGLKIFLFNRTRTHRFERWCGMLAIDSKGLLRSDRRELPLDCIADVVIEEIRGRWRRSSASGGRWSRSFSPPPMPAPSGTSACRKKWP